jgi:hypothetical protein
VRLPFALVASLATSGCTAIVLSDATGDPEVPCESASDCAAGSRCDDGTCAAEDGDGEPPPAPGSIGEDGGVLEGPDGVRLVIPAHALDGVVTFTIARASSTTVAETADGTVAPRSRFYSVAPAIALALAATLDVPLDEECGTCTVFQESDDAWVALGAAPGAPVQTARAVTTSLERFVAGRVE